MAHKHSVHDTDAHFKIDPATRAIQSEASAKTTLIQHDHNSERFTFELPRMIDGHDMSLCNAVEIHYLNVEATNKDNATSGLYEVDDLQVSPDSEDIVICSWLISDNATKFAGSLNFVLKFKCVDDSGVVDYRWSTGIHTAIAVSKGIDNGEVIVEEYADVLEQWRVSLDDYGARITALERSGGGISARVAEVTLYGSAWVANGRSHSQVVQIDGVTENSQVDLTPSADQLAIFHEKDLAFVTENEDGVVTVYAIGDKPSNDYTMQVTITEVYV